MPLFGALFDLSAFEAKSSLTSKITPDGNGGIAPVKKFCFY